MTNHFLKRRQLLRAIFLATTLHAGVSVLVEHPGDNGAQLELSSNVSGGLSVSEAWQTSNIEDSASASKEEWDDGVVECSYGVDISFPMHFSSFSAVDRRNSHVQESLYAYHMQGCREAYPNVAALCDENEEERIEANLAIPMSLENYTDTGYKKVRAPQEMWDILERFWKQNQNAGYEEDLGEANIYMNGWQSPCYITDLGDDVLIGGGEVVMDVVNELARPLLEEWSGQDLTPTFLYGIRTYTEGSILSPHVDDAGRVISAIVNVAQDVDGEPWILEVIDHFGKAINITMEPRDMVMYESRTVIHGRPYPLRGSHYSNLFLHFEPVGYEKGFA